MKNINVYRSLVVLRFALVFLPQLGYIHPDEFFQSSEIAAGDIFRNDVLRTWEFNSTRPIRSIVFPYIICGTPFVIFRSLLEVFHFDIPNVYFLLVLPRFVTTLFTYGIDIFLKKLCHLHKVDHIPVLLTFSTSYVTLTYLTRSLSNSVETALFSAVLFYMCKAFRGVNNSPKTSSVSTTNLFTIGFLLACGVFNRPTFVAFSIAPLAIWVQLGGDSNFLTKFNRRVSELIPGFLFGVFLFLVCDSIYFRGISDVLDNWLNATVCTPCNFVNYNLNSTNLAEHGLHPAWLHMVVNVPLLFGYLGILGLVSYWRILGNLILRGEFKLDLIESLMYCSFIVPILCLSVFEHQEPRFIIPVIFPLVFLHSDKIWGRKWTSPSRVIWLTFNALMILFYGFFHQGGITSSALDVARVVTNQPQKVHFVFYHTYMPPRHLFNTQFPTSKIEIRDLAGAKYYSLQSEIFNIFDSDVNATVYLFSPSSLRIGLKNRLKYKYRSNVLKKYPFHISTEDFPDFRFRWKDHYTLLDYVYGVIDNVYNQIGLDFTLISLRKT